MRHCLALILLLGGNVATSAPPEVVIVPPPKAGERTELKVPAGEIVKLQAAPASEWEIDDNPAPHVFDSGKYAVFLLAPGEKLRVTVTGPDKAKTRLTLVASGEPGPPPKPPEPIDALKAAVAKAYADDASPDKAEQRKNLAALYRAASDLATKKNAKGEYADATLGAFLARLQTASDDFVGDAALKGVRQIVRGELNKLFATDGPLADADRLKLAALFTRLATILDGL